jgi:hypothetical protein
VDAVTGMTIAALRQLTNKNHWWFRGDQHVYFVSQNYINQRTPRPKAI